MVSTHEEADRTGRWHIKALATTLAKVCFFILRDGVTFDAKKLVG